MNSSIGDIDVRADAAEPIVWLDAFGDYSDTTVAMTPDQARAVADALLYAARIIDRED